jgi:hypothetical protein
MLRNLRQDLRDPYVRRRVWGVHLHSGFGSGLATRLWFGLAVVAVGVLWTLDNLRLVDSDRIVRWWPVLLIGFGVSRLFDHGRRRPLAAWFWIAIGSVLLLQHLGYIPWGLHEFWPVVLILVGASIVWRGVRGPSAGVVLGASASGWPAGGVAGSGVAPSAAGADPGAGPEASRTTGETTPGETFSALAIWSGVERKCTSQTFRGGDFTALMGGGVVDVRVAKPVPGGAVVELTAIMGGIEVLVPEDWEVINEIHCVMGGVEDTRAATPPNPGLVLHLRGIVMMGGVEIRSTRHK